MAAPEESKIIEKHSKYLTRKKFKTSTKVKNMSEDVKKGKIAFKTIRNIQDLQKFGLQPPSRVHSSAATAAALVAASKPTSKNVKRNNTGKYKKRRVRSPNAKFAHLTPSSRT